MSVTSSVEEWSSIPDDVSSSFANVNDAYFDRDFRMAILITELLIGIVGCMLLCAWLSSQRKSRINGLLWHVTISDLLVFLVASMPQLVWEAYGRHWGLGLTACRTFKYSQSVVMMASNFMLVALSVDRHNAIVMPLRPPIEVWRLTTVGWATAAILSMPHPFMYVLNDQAVANKTLCESIWRNKTRTQRGLYLTFISVVTFFIPLIAMCYCYIRIFVTVATRANASCKKTTVVERKQRQSKGSLSSTLDDVILAVNTTQSSYLPRAKSKTLKMTIVIISVFIACGLPYHVLEMVYSFSDHRLLSGVPSAIMGAMAIANSAANPYIVLGFNACFYKCLYVLTPRACTCCALRKDHWNDLYLGVTQRTSLPNTTQYICTPLNRSPIAVPRRSTLRSSSVNDLGLEIDYVSNKLMTTSHSSRWLSVDVGPSSGGLHVNHVTRLVPLHTHLSLSRDLPTGV